MELSVESFDKICRACLKESSNMKSLFTKFESGHQLLDLLVYTANVCINREDGLPKQICGDCEAFVHKVDEFKRRCMESEGILKNLCGSTFDQYFAENEAKTCDNVGKTNMKTAFEAEELEQTDLISLFSNSEISIRKTETSEPEQKVKQEIPAEYESHNDYSNDFDNTEQLDIIPECKLEKFDPKSAKKNEPKYECICGQEFYTKTNYLQHLKILNCNKYKKYFNKLKPSDTKTFIPVSVINEMPCHKCDRKFANMVLLTEHVKTHIIDEPAFECSMCFRKFKTKKTLSRHIKHHLLKDNIKHTCTKCKREFKYKAFLESHMLSVHNQDSFGCDICDEKFPTKESLDSHQQVHITRKNVCSYCSKSFPMASTLKDHLRTHTGEKPFLCSTCGKGFSQKTNLAQHMRRHMGLKHFKCDSCEMGFVSKGELDAHTRKHSGAHPFVCDDCSKGFTTSSALVKHRRIHTGERPYACDLCPMKFRASGTLTNHRRTHTGERPYQCSYCEKSFVQRSDLISHIRCHTGERPFVCPQCGQAFRKAAAMKAHVRMHAREGHGVNMIMPCDQLNAV